MCSETKSVLLHLHTYSRGCSLRRTHNLAKDFIKNFIYSTFSVFSFEIIFIVRNIKAASLPHVTVVFLILLQGVNEGLHALGIRTILLIQIHNVELISKP